MKSALIALVALAACGSEPMQVNHPAPGHRVAFSGPTIIGTVTSVTAGSGLTGGTITRNGTIAVDSTSVQSRVTGACTGLNTIQSINADGTVTCVSSGGGGGGTVTSVSGGTGIAVTNPTTTPTVALSNVAGNTIMGNNTAGSAPPTALTGTQATALLDVFGALKGLVPSSPGGTTVYLRGDGMWATPPGTGVTNVDTLAPLQDGPITGSGTVSLTLCPANQLYKVNGGGTAWACAADGGVTGTGTSGTVPLWSSTTGLGNSSISDNGTTVSTTEKVSVSTNAATTTVIPLALQRTDTATTGDVTEVDIGQNTAQAKLYATTTNTSDLSGSFGIATRWFNGTDYNNVDLLIAGGNITLGSSPSNAHTMHGSLTLTDGALDLNTHQIHNVTDPSSAQDAATKNYVDTATTNEITGTLTSGTVPVATGAHTQADSEITDDTTGHVVNVFSPTTSTTATDSGFSITKGGASTPVLVDAKAQTGQGMSFRIGSGTSAASAHTWMNVDGIGRVGFPLATTVTGTFTTTTTTSLNATTASTLTSTGAFTASSTAHVVGAATLDSTLAVGGHVGTTGTAPTLSSCGTSPTVTGTDTAGIITLGTSSGGNCTVTFASAYTSTPACTITLTTAGTAAASISARSASAFTVHSPTDISGSMVSYICIGNPN